MVIFATGPKGRGGALRPTHQPLQVALEQPTEVSPQNSKPVAKNEGMYKDVTRSGPPGGGALRVTKLINACKMPRVSSSEKPGSAHVLFIADLRRARCLTFSSL